MDKLELQTLNLMGITDMLEVVENQTIRIMFRPSKIQDKEKVKEAFKLILRDPNVEAILVNIFGGIIRCDMVASSIIEASEEIELNIPLAVRFSGTNHSEGKQILDDCDLDIITASTLAEAGEAIVKVIGGTPQ